jgi:hypothetical protein
MPKNFFPRILLCVVCLLQFFTAPWSSGQANSKKTAAKEFSLPDPPLRWTSRKSTEDSIALDGDDLLEALTVAVQLPAVATGQVTQADAKGGRLRPTLPGAWQPLLQSGRHYFLEVDGPQSHAWSGHRLEIDEGQTLRGDTRTVVWEISPRNTRAPHASLAGASYLVRPHLTLPMLFSRSWASFLQNKPGLGPIQGTISRPGGGTEDFQVSRNAKNGTMVWQIGGRTTAEEKLILPPGSGLVVRLPSSMGLGVGLRGETRTFPCRTPLASGWNLIGYPFPQPLRLTQDWGTADTTMSAGLNPSHCDRIVVVLQGTTKEYALWKSPSGPRWRRTQPGGGQWQTSLELLDTLPPGFSFYLYRHKPNPHHVFLPPAP